MITDVKDVPGIRGAYARQRVSAGLPPFRGKATLRPGLHGPCCYRLPGGRVVTLFLPDGRGGETPAPAAR